MSDRLTRILGLFETGGDTDAGPPRLCEVCAEAVGVTGAGVMLMSGDAQRGSVCNSDEVSALIEELQYTLARAVLAMRSGVPPGALGAELQAQSEFHFVVHQAAGMVSAQLDVSVAEALIRLRAHAFAGDRPLTAVAEDVVARRLRFA